MARILAELRWCDKERIRKASRCQKDAGLKTRYLIIVNLMNGRTVGQTIQALQACRSTVYRVAKRFLAYAEAGPVDRREENGDRKQGQRLRLHFLPPYCPDHNPIERTWRDLHWRDLHAAVTRSHRCPAINLLMKEVRAWIKNRNHKINRTLAS